MGGLAVVAVAVVLIVMLACCVAPVLAGHPANDPEGDEWTR